MHTTQSSTFRRSVCLNGIWDFSICSDSIDSLPDQWETVGIKVPSPFNVNSFMQSYTRSFCGEECFVQGGDFRLYPEYPTAWEKARCGFYRRHFRVGDSSKGNRLFLRFDAVAFHCAFYLNGQRIGETMEAFLPIELEITDSVLYGTENELIVACETAHHLIYKGRDGRNRLDFPQGSFWGSHIAGIWCDAWLIECPSAFVDDVFAVTDTDARTLTVRYASCHTRTETVTFTLKKWGSDDSPRVLGSALPATGEFDWSWAEGEIALWDFLEPNLYELTALLVRNGRTVDERTVRIGFRTMRAEGEKFVLNGRRINLKIDAWHYLGYTIQTPEYARAYYRMALDAGVNIIRLHAEPFPEFFLDIADEMGMLLVSESAVWASHCMFSYSPAFFEHSRDHLARMIQRDRNHPSVVMWSPENECIPAYHFCGSDYVKSVPELETLIYDFIRVIDAYDTSRLISCDGSGDLGGRLPVNSIHYPRYECPTHRGKPITIGEMGSMYYSTPETVCQEYGPRTLECFEGRLESVSEDAFHDLVGERKWASQICVFNLVWYGLRPLPFRDRTLVWDDYTTPGIKPSRITPYMRTLNANADPDLPDYLPNPVWNRAKEAYIPARSFVEHCPERVPAGQDCTFEISTFNDLREDTEFTLSVRLGKSVWNADIRIPSCEYREDRVILQAPEAGPAELTVSLLQNGNPVHTFSRAIDSIDVRALDNEFSDLGVILLSGDSPVPASPCIDCRDLRPYRSFVRKTRQQHFFLQGEKIGYPGPVECGVFEPSLCFGGIPVLTDGSGQAIAIDLSCTGERRIVCALDLTKSDPTTALLRVKLARLLSCESPVQPARPLFVGHPDSALAGMLKSLNIDAEFLAADDLSGLPVIDPGRLLILDGPEAASPLASVLGRFRRVLLASPRAVPRMFCNELRIREDKIFHLVPRNGAVPMTGLSSSALYGLESNREQILASGCLEHLSGQDGILLGVPDVDWRLWNNNAEPLKTVAVLRSELRDLSRYSAFSVLERAGTRFFVSTLSADSSSSKQRNIWARVLSALGAMPALTPASETGLLSADLYTDHVRMMLGRVSLTDEDPASVRPIPDEPEGDDVWRITRGERAEHMLYALYILSPQDRSDLLRNPDQIDMEASCESEAEYYLNGTPLATGSHCKIAGLQLSGGSNCLLCRVKGSAPMPKITFRRSKHMPLDLTFSLDRP